MTRWGFLLVVVGVYRNYRRDKKMDNEISASILISEPDLGFRLFIESFLSENGFSVSIEDFECHVSQRVRRENPDLVILGFTHKGKTGFDICACVRPFFLGSILMIADKNGVDEEILGLQLGADDYIVRPIEPKLLLARIKKLLETPGAHTVRKINELCFGSLSINKISRTVILDKLVVSLTSREFDFLLDLSMRAGKIQSRESIYHRIYGRQYNGLERTLDVHIVRLRKKLHDNTEKPFRIKTVWGRGYLFVADAWQSITPP